MSPQTAQQTAQQPAFSAPPHVPPELVIPFDFFTGPEYQRDPFDHLHKLFKMPRVFYTPTHYAKPGCWVLSRNEDVRHVLQHTELFSSTGSVKYASLIGESWDMIPVELDPPQHTPFRMLLNPIFSPKEVERLDATVRSTAADLIHGFRDRGECDFVNAFARPFPISIFLRILGLPTTNLIEFAEWAAGIMASFNMDVMRSSMRAMVDYLRVQIAERKARPNGDLLSKIVHAQINGRPVTDDEVMGTSFLLFIAGLDTVSSSLAFHFHFLATHPEIQQQLRNDRSLIPAAVEEFLRRNAVVSLNRLVLQDTEVAGIKMQKGDWVMLSLAGASNDPSEFTHPEQFDLQRPMSTQAAFSYGPHRCLGSHLARREFSAALNGWFDNLPPFRIKPGTQPIGHGGVIFGIDNLTLAW